MSQGRMHLDHAADGEVDTYSTNPMGGSALDRLRTHGLLPLATTICKRHGIPPENVLGTKTRMRDLVRCKDEIILAVQQLRDWNPGFLGLLFDMDRSSIIAALHRQRGGPPRAIKAAVKAAVLARDGNICQLCMKPIHDDERSEIDHIVPSSQGGLSVLENLRHTHSFCNRKRGNGLVTYGPKIGTAKVIDWEQVGAERERSRGGVGSESVPNGVAIGTTQVPSGDAVGISGLGSASRASEASLCSPSLAESIPVVAVCSEQTREARTAPVQTKSKEATEMAARIASHSEFAALNALAIASKFEGWRMARGEKPAVADVLRSIDDYALVACANAGTPVNELARGLTSYMRAARPEKAAPVHEPRAARPGSSWREQQASAGPGIDYAELKQERVAPAVPSGDVLARLEALGTRPRRQDVGEAADVSTCQSAALPNAPGVASHQPPLSPPQMQERLDVTRQCATKGE